MVHRADYEKGWVKATKVKDSVEGDEFEETYIYSIKNPSALFKDGRVEPKTFKTAESAEDFVNSGTENNMCEKIYMHVWKRRTYGKLDKKKTLQ